MRREAFLADVFITGVNAITLIEGSMIREEGWINVVLVGEELGI